MTWLQRDPGGEQWEAIRERVDAAVAQGLPLYLQAAARGIGVIIGLDASFHPFMGFPGYKEIAAPAARRARRGDARSGPQGARPRREIGPRRRRRHARSRRWSTSCSRASS